MVRVFIGPLCHNHCEQDPRLRHTGTAIWVYGILANTAGTGVTIFTNTSFELDGTLAGRYEHIPDPTQQQYIYNVSMFQSTGLTFGEHTLMMMAMQGSEPSLLMFDYAVYT